MPSPATYHNYVLHDNKIGREIDRLNKQHFWLTSSFGHPQLVPPSIDLSKVTKVLDVASGTGIWALEFSKLPHIKQRNADPAVDNRVHIYACDLDMSKFSSRVMESHNINIFYQDVTTPFPTSMHGTFDLVHMSLLVWALTRRGWESALRNLRDLLKPGGWLLLHEMDTVMYSGISPPYPPPPCLEHDFNAVLNGSSTLCKMNALCTAKGLQKNYIPTLSYHLPTLCKSAGLSISSSSRAFGPIGRFCEIQRSLSGSSLAHFRQESVHDFLRIFEMFTEMWLQKGELESPLGVKIKDEHERRLLMREFEKRLEEGAMVILSEFVVQRAQV